MRLLRQLTLYVVALLLVGGCTSEPQAFQPAADTSSIYAPDIPIFESVESVPFSFDVVQVLQKDWVAANLFFIEVVTRQEGATAIVAVSTDMRVRTIKGDGTAQSVNKGSYLLIRKSA